jgi:hypothetical protein
MKKLLALTGLAAMFVTTAAFAETYTGVVSDAMCAKNPAKASAPSHADCAKKCIQDGEKPVLIVGDKVYTITNPDILVSHAGEKVTVDATAKDNALTVNSVK